MNFFKFFILFIFSLFAEDKSLMVTSQNLNQKGLNIFLEKLPSDLVDIYSQDDDFIKEFPFILYKKVDINQLGSFFIDIQNDVIKRCLSKNEEWESGIANIIKKYAKKGSLALDIGAHIGTHSITMSQAVGDEGRVIAFEPNKKIFRELCYNLAASNIKNVIPARLAIGKFVEAITTVTPLYWNEGGTFVVKANEFDEASAQLRLDDLELENISLIKIDVENMEADVIDGAIQTLKRCRPVLIVEIQGNAERPMILKENNKHMAKISIQKIKNLKYEMRLIGGNDYLCIPK
jgi:FkbM family methyltransferase